MYWSQLALDDILLFGSLILAALGSGLVVIGSTANVLLALGTTLIVFGVPGVVIAFLAAAEVGQK